mgnify:CR=1 FL=1
MGSDLVEGTDESGPGRQTDTRTNRPVRNEPNPVHFDSAPPPESSLPSTRAAAARPHTRSQSNTQHNTHNTHTTHTQHTPNTHPTHTQQTPNTHPTHTQHTHNTHPTLTQHTHNTHTTQHTFTHTFKHTLTHTFFFLVSSWSRLNA